MAAMKYFVVVLTVCVGVTWANSAGAPLAACEKLTPQHGPVNPQTSPVPYALNVSSKLRRGQTVNITLRGNGNEDKIKGFLIQARNGGQALGTFSPLDGNSQLLDCDGVKGSSITHKLITVDGGVSEVSFKWTAPADFVGQVNFVGTVALNGGVFWNTLRSNTVSVV